MNGYINIMYIQIVYQREYLCIGRIMGTSAINYSVLLTQTFIHSNINWSDDLRMKFLFDIKKSTNNEIQK